MSEKPSVKVVYRWACNDCDAVGPRVTMENYTEILAKINKKRERRGVELLVLDRDFLESNHDEAEAVCRIHAVTQHEKHEPENISIIGEKHINISPELIKKIVADKLAETEQSKEN